MNACATACLGQQATKYLCAASCLPHGGEKKPETELIRRRRKPQEGQRRGISRSPFWQGTWIPTKASRLHAKLYIRICTIVAAQVSHRIKLSEDKLSHVPLAEQAGRERKGVLCSSHSPPWVAGIGWFNCHSKEPPPVKFELRPSKSFASSCSLLLTTPSKGPDKPLKQSPGSQQQNCCKQRRKLRSKFKKPSNKLNTWWVGRHGFYGGVRCVMLLDDLFVFNFTVYCKLRCTRDC